MNERACPRCGEECFGAIVHDGQRFCCGYGCEHCCEVDRLAMKLRMVWSYTRAAWRDESGDFWLFNRARREWACYRG